MAEEAKDESFQAAILEAVYAQVEFVHYPEYAGSYKWTATLAGLTSPGESPGEALSAIFRAMNFFLPSERTRFQTAVGHSLDFSKKIILHRRQVLHEGA